MQAHTLSPTFYCLEVGLFVKQLPEQPLVYILTKVQSMSSMVDRISSNKMEIILKFIWAPKHRRLEERRVAESPPIVSTQEDSRLLALPAEIRLYIYELMLRSDSGTVELGQLPKKRPPLTPSMLQTCRRVLYEAEDIFYSINHFKYTTPFSGRTLASFLDSIGPARRNAVTTLTVCTTSSGRAFQSMEELRSVPDLRSWHTVLWMSTECICRPIRPPIRTANLALY